MEARMPQVAELLVAKGSRATRGTGLSARRKWPRARNWQTYCQCLPGLFVPGVISNVT